MRAKRKVFSLKTTLATGATSPGMICMYSQLIRHAPCSRAMAWAVPRTSGIVRVRSKRPPKPPVARTVAAALMPQRRFLSRA